jgi:hypothetical protein
MCSWDGRSTGAGEDEPEDGGSLDRYLMYVAERRAVRLAQRPALCCECGTARLTSAHGSRTTTPDGERCTVLRKCETCGVRTQHAYLLVPGRTDCAERDRPYPALDDATEEQLLELELDDARALGVLISDRSVSDRILVSVTQQLDDGVWAVCLDPETTARRRRLGLRTALEAIRDARKRRWYVVTPDADHARPAVRFAVFAEPDENSADHGDTR